MDVGTNLRIRIDDTTEVSAILDAPADSRALYVFAHGAGAGMAHPFMQDVAAGLAARHVAVLRYQFPFMEQGSKRTDAAPLAQAAVRAAVRCGATRVPDLPIHSGGKSFGARMTSQAQAASPLPGVVGLVFVGFPLHPAGKPSIARAAHLDAVDVPMLFVQGTRDALAETDLMTPMVAALGPRATLLLLDDADHGFHVRKSSGSDDETTLATLLDAMAAWMLRPGPRNPAQQLMAGVVSHRQEDVPKRGTSTIRFGVCAASPVRSRDAARRSGRSVG